MIIFSAYIDMHKQPRERRHLEIFFYVLHFFYVFFLSLFTSLCFIKIVPGVVTLLVFYRLRSSLCGCEEGLGVWRAQTVEPWHTNNIIYIYYFPLFWKYELEKVLCCDTKNWNQCILKSICKLITVTGCQAISLFSKYSSVRARTSSYTQITVSDTVSVKHIAVLFFIYFCCVLWFYCVCSSNAPTFSSLPSKD